MVLANPMHTLCMYAELLCNCTLNSIEITQPHTVCCSHVTRTACTMQSCVSECALYSSENLCPCID